MAEASKGVLRPPTAAEVDELAILYDKLKAKLFDQTLAQKAAADELAAAKEKCVELLTSFGSTRAEKSKLLHGLKWEIMGTFGTSTSVDAAAVERLREHLSTDGETRLVKRLFEKTIRWTLRSTARAEILKDDVPAKVRALFAACEVTKDKSPAIDARLKSD